LWVQVPSLTHFYLIMNINEAALKEKALWDLYRKAPSESAYNVLYGWQKYLFFASLLLMLAIILSVNFSYVFTAFVIIINIVFVIMNPIKLYISALALKGFTKTVVITQKDVKTVKDEALPMYTILLPVYKEVEVLRYLIKNIMKLDYPKDKLDVKLLMDESDLETYKEAKKLGLIDGTHPLSSAIDPIIVPNDVIRTKARVCNYGLYKAKGKYCVIYDAEDDPEPDQLKKAAIAFSRLGEKVFCLQSRLNYYNPKDNLLTRAFALEYSFWFDYYLEGLDKVGAPLPLGGTSNHFRTNDLIDIGGWDPFNMTEDADLGIRIARRGKITHMLNSYTYEEAPPKLWGWIKQRSRWYKGFFQTYLVNLRNPRKLIREMGLKQFLYFQMTFVSHLFLPMISLLIWIATLAMLLYPGSLRVAMIHSLEVICILNLVLGNIVFLLLNIMPALVKKDYSSVPMLLYLPFYWLFISIGAWRGFFQLMINPFYWEKTIHGASRVHERHI
jgi:glycosyltransferase XagB